MANLIGYARVSTTEQDPAAQVDALNAAGCLRVFSDHASGALDERPALSSCLEYLRPDDTLVVYRLDRLGRSVPHLLKTIDELANRGVGFRSLSEAIDTESASGRLVLNVFAAMSAFELDLIRERTAAGMAAARARGSSPGRPTKLTATRLRAARQMLDAGTPATEVAKAMNIGRTTLYRHLKVS
ncbi:MAG: recombinase family protein [Actinomycetes bacterium]